MVTCQSSELGWEVTVELPIDFLSLGRGSVNNTILGLSMRPSSVVKGEGRHREGRGSGLSPNGNKFL